MATTAGQAAAPAGNYEPDLGRQIRAVSDNQWRHIYTMQYTYMYTIYIYIDIYLHMYLGGGDRQVHAYIYV